MWIRLSFAYQRPVAELQEVIDSKHFTELATYDRVYGLPDAWLRTVAVGLCGKDARPLPEHVMAGARKRQTVDEMASVLKNVARSTQLAAERGAFR